ncbi:MAG: class I SAM-dependent methyltransferase [Chloroflexi bacterium]|nr:class I SAM-dependent methyltransferase [Chloroflexota bacterium]
MMSYRVRSEYREASGAAWYDARYRSSPAAKLANWSERTAFRSLLARVPAHQRVLDVACGSGRFLEELVNEGHRATGLDVSTSMLARAAGRLGPDSRLEGLLVADAEHLPFESGAFDGITCVRLYHKVPDAARTTMLEEVRRTARWAILYFSVSTPWLETRRTLLHQVRGHDAGRFPMTRSRIRAELRQADLRLCGEAWVLPGVFDGLFALVRC